MENELHNMRKEMDELKSAMKDKGWDDLKDGLTIHCWSTELSSPTKILSPRVGVVWQFQGSLRWHWIIQDVDAIVDDLRQGDM